MTEEEYETLPTHKLWVHFVAGSMAGLAEHCVMFPFDSVKTRLQSLVTCPEVKCPTAMHCVMSMAKREGWRRPFRGVNAMIAGAVPAHALYYTVYERFKYMLTSQSGSVRDTLGCGLAGAFATVAHDAVMNPAEVVKQRMQMLFSPYGSCVECARCVYRQEGFSAFYRSYTTQLIMNIPYQSIHFMTYEFVQNILNPNHTYHPLSHLIAGGIAGGFAAAVTTPLDCIKTVLNTQQSPEVGIRCRLLKKNSSVSYKGIFDAIRSIYSLRGSLGFFRGIQARVVYQVPSTALSWSVYEFFKFFLSFDYEF
uniref:Mitoferrin n=1 Tax=Syphacia muris TaxID=451379 RepID=A0A0N5AM22_9BILA